MEWLLASFSPCEWYDEARSWRCGAGAPLFLLLHLLRHLFPFLLFPFFHWLCLFSSFVHPFPFYQNSPTPFPGRRSKEVTEPGFSLFFLYNLCYLYSLVKMHCGVLFYLVYLCVFLQCFDTVGWVIWPVKTRPDMTYNVFGGTLSLTQSIKLKVTSVVIWLHCGMEMVVSS